MENLKRILPPLTSILAFEAAARLGSFSEAARELNVTREAVSRQIRTLEAHLGLSLFERTANGTELRSWGRRYYETISTSLGNIAVASHAVRGDTGAVTLPADPMDLPDDLPVVLIVDDAPENIRRLYEVLRGQYEVIAQTRPEEALAWLLNGGHPDLIMLDVRMTGMDGYALCRRIKTEPDLARVPVMFLTSLDSTDDETEGFAAGACDYIARPFVPAILLARLRVQIDLRQTTAALEDLLKRRGDRLERMDELLIQFRRQIDALDP
ncbi:response regulator [Sinirhodobacter populi]|uniref:Response regulator n=1 Tax=Paenirhodobacter populi TaxID=2306993 RepID=A0A443K6N8_9RHOB|nr:response regulator [Sinirhodobacter populi]RWR28424.1 response regulator [Sinirhodobacter populi]